MELQDFMTEDLCLTTEIFRRLVPGLCQQEIETYLKFIKKANALYDSEFPGVRQKFEQELVLTNAGPDGRIYQTLALNLEIIELGLGYWQANRRSVYEYTTLYRPQLWLRIDLDWCREMEEEIAILTQAPPLRSLEKD